MRDHEDAVNPAENGKYVHGLFLEGAAWETGAEGQDGYLIDQRPKELHPRMPVINVIALPLEKRKTEGQYDCPVYVTSARGMTYVFRANLNMEDDSSAKWILSGTCLLMSDD